MHYVAVQQFRPHLYAGTVLQSSESAPPLDSLRDATGAPVDLAAYDGDVVVLYFGYTNCPDVCPTTLSDLARARSGLSDGDQERVHVMMVSVDPARDDAASLQTYVEFFDPSFMGVTGEVADIDRVAAGYGVFYELGEGTVETGYTVDHTASLMAIGTDGALRVLWGPDVSSDALRDDLKELL